MSFFEPTPADCENFLDFVDDYLKARHIAESPYATEEILRKMAVTDWKGYTYYVRAGIALNPNVPEDLVKYLMSVATDRREWAAIGSYWRKRVGAQEPQHIDSIPDGSFPFELVSGQPLDENERYRIIFDNMPAFAEVMWNELGKQGIIPLDYWQDHIDGDLFGPINWMSGLGDRLVYSVLGRGYFTDWIEREGHVDVSYALEYAYDFSEDFFDDWTYLVEDDPFHVALLFNIAAFGDGDGHLKVNLEAEDWQDIADEAMEGDETMFDFDVTVTGDAPWEGAKWGELAYEARAAFTRNLILAKDHPYLGGWGFIPHLLALIAVHPRTERSLVEEIKALGLENVNTVIDAREAAK